MRDGAPVASRRMAGPSWSGLARATSSSGGLLHEAGLDLEPPSTSLSRGIAPIGLPLAPRTLCLFSACAPEGLIQRGDPILYSVPKAGELFRFRSPQAAERVWGNVG